MLNLLKLCKEEKDMSTSDQIDITDVLIIVQGSQVLVQPTI